MRSLIYGMLLFGFVAHAGAASPTVFVGTAEHASAAESIATAQWIALHDAEVDAFRACVESGAVGCVLLQDAYISSCNALQCVAEAHARGQFL